MNPIACPPKRGGSNAEINYFISRISDSYFLSDVLFSENIFARLFVLVNERIEDFLRGIEQLYRFDQFFEGQLSSQLKIRAGTFKYTFSLSKKFSCLKNDFFGVIQKLAELI